MYPEIKATEVTFSAITLLLLWPLLQDNEIQLVESKETHCLSTTKEARTTMHGGRKKKRESSTDENEGKEKKYGNGKIMRGRRKKKKRERERKKRERESFRAMENDFLRDETSVIIRFFMESKHSSKQAKESSWKNCPDNYIFCFIAKY